MRFKVDCAFIFGDVSEEDVNEDVLVRLVPFMPRIRGRERTGYLTRVGTGAGGGAEDSGALVVSTDSLSLIVPSSEPVFSFDLSSGTVTISNAAFQGMYLEQNKVIP